MSNEPEVGSIESVEAQVSDVDRIVMKLEKVLEGDRLDHAVIGLVALAIFLMNPKIGQEQLERAIEQTTNFAAMQALDADMVQSLESMQPVTSAAN